jgi:hypothetical protein
MRNEKQVGEVGASDSGVWVHAGGVWNIGSRCDVAMECES